jgi:putative nucleotidyltransferase with HDIG domain
MKLLRRLVPAWLLVSAVTGAIVYFVELEKIDGLAIGMDGVPRAVVQTLMVVLVTTIILYPIIISLNRELLRRSKELYQADLGMIEILGNAMAKRDSDTNTHNYRVTIYAIRLAEAIGGFTREAMQGLIKGAFLHDLGKIAISDTILLKPDLLTPEETRIMRTHVEHGIDIIRDYHWLADALDVVSYHHEQFDGKGFKGVQGEEIPLNARIFAVCDVFDALTSKRPYKKPVSFDESFQMIQQLRGTHLDPALVETFNSIAEGLYAKVSKADEDSLKIMLKQHVDRYFGAQTAVPRGQGTGAAS